MPLAIGNKFYCFDQGYHSAIHCSAFSELKINNFADYTTDDGSWIKRKLFHEHLGFVQGENFKIIADPLFEFTYSRDVERNENMYENTRGLMLYAELYKKITLISSYYENQASMPGYIDDYYNVFRVIPGEARVKPYRNDAYDWGTAYASLSYKPTRFLYVETGNDKNFIGDGYRSLILSDYAPQYLYFKTVLSAKNFFYMNLATRTLNPNYNNINGDTPDWSENSLYPHKFVNINYLGYNPTLFLQLGVFEATAFGTNAQFSKKITAFFPGLNEALYHTNDTLHFIWGGNFLFSPVSNVGIYGQFAYGQKQAAAYQAGCKVTIVNTRWMRFIFGRIEWNYVGAGMYQPLGNENYWGHYNQVLAHPAGNDFSEIIVQAAVSRIRFKVSLTGGMIYYRTGLGARGIFSANINDAMEPDRVVFSQARIAYVVNYAYHWQFFASATYYSRKNSGEHYIMPSVGIKTCLRNQYHDF
ncbi:MAG: hypothetical protein KBB11_04065 [Bacteroidales bacterium]|nr:hypothetical protein [Bacteroidales bacterium]HOY38486.1 hypothetical protein [Bacteroidales bacterium]HQP05008.1 hypothetical protein [Bacteroidales bacterium]